MMPRCWGRLEVVVASDDAAGGGAGWRCRRGDSWLRDACSEEWTDGEREKRQLPHLAPTASRRELGSAIGVNATRESETHARETQRKNLAQPPERLVSPLSKCSCPVTSKPTRLTRRYFAGHSFGGAAALHFCHQDPRCKAGIDVDGAPHGSVIQAGIDRPFMFLLSDHSRESEPESGQIMANIRSIYDRLPTDGRALLEIRGANHFLFSDDGALLKSHIVLRTLRMLGIVGIEGRRQLAVTAYCLRSFFDACLKGESVSRFKSSSPLYPEIQVLE